MGVGGRGEDKVSFLNLKEVSQDELHERMETVRDLESTETESYAVMKDQTTGEHYLHYAYLHVNLADGSKEFYHHLMPIDHDDVLAIVLGEQSYEYPTQWKSKYLRNGPSGYYVWFDPHGLNNEDQDEEWGQEVKNALMEFKKKGQFDKESVKKFFEEIDRLDKDST